ncbi:hypothetical protein CBR_g41640 [Chara braunii]|uniref:Uncharacterized protein n=1 Tax=Chara braunii TaxID=69332 RepID=A0A388LW74_CHABU|nr:hypothetical protein CBR_g41640 [Chara braunii]|eukprot:GBG86578.1 hypothetical protein CBR_g41640 [Chara braunii]
MWRAATPAASCAAPNLSGPTVCGKELAARSSSNSHLGGDDSSLAHRSHTRGVSGGQHVVLLHGRAGGCNTGTCEFFVRCDGTYDYGRSFAVKHRRRRLRTASTLQISRISYAVTHMHVYHHPPRGTRLPPRRHDFCSRHHHFTDRCEYPYARHRPFGALVEGPPQLRVSLANSSDPLRTRKFALRDSFQLEIAFSASLKPSLSSSSSSSSSSSTYTCTSSSSSFFSSCCDSSARSVGSAGGLASACHVLNSNAPLDRRQGLHYFLRFEPGFHWRGGGSFLCRAVKGNREGDIGEGEGDEVSNKREEEEEEDKEDIKAADGSKGGVEMDDDEAESVNKDVEGALPDAEIPPTSDGFLRKVSSPTYRLASQLEQVLETNYDVLEQNPWVESNKPVYVLAKEETALVTMRTRWSRSEVEKELGLLFPKRGSRRGSNGQPRSSDHASAKKGGGSIRGQGSKVSTGSELAGVRKEEGRFRMHVEDMREGVLVFEDGEEAARYCDILEGSGLNCMGVAEINASEVFALCQRSKALAVLFRQGATPPPPSRLQMNLKARKWSLEEDD